MNENYGSTLNDNEIIVIQYLCKGLSSKQVAHEMKLSKRTIDHYREKIYSKTKTSNVAALAIYAYQNNLL